MSAPTSLPPLKWVPSPNFEARPGPVTLIVLHDCEGSYQSAIHTFQDGTPGNRVSAHFVLKEDGSEVSQMVSLDKAAWHCRSFNGRSIGVEMAGFAERGFQPSEWDSAARIVAYLLHRYGLPCQWAHRGATPGFTSHFDLGKAGGGHSDPTTDLHIWQGLIDRVQSAYAAGGFPTSWARGEPVAPVAPPIHGPAWVQASLNKLGADPQLVVDGDIGPRTKAQLMVWQFNAHLPQTGQADPATVAALEKALGSKGV